MLPTVKEAKRELEAAAQLNPGPWIEHSINTGIAARNIAEKISGMDSEKAYVVGLLHDIGRRIGIVDIPRHVYEGYLFCEKMGWDEAARVCMTHSYPLMEKEFDYVPFKCFWSLPLHILHVLFPSKNRTAGNQKIYFRMYM